MAYAALSSLTQTITLILNHHHQALISTQLKNQIKSIHKNVTFLQSVLPDFPKKPNTLEDKIRDVAYKAEDIVEILWSENSKSNVNQAKEEEKKKNQKHLCYEFSDLEKVTKEVEEVVKEVRERDKEVVVGFDGESTKVKGQLLTDSPKLQTVPIVGMPGIGKTTLAKYVYDDDLIKETFDVRAWVRVSEHYNVQEIVSSLRVSIGVSEAKDGTTERDVVYKSLFGKRYLIVLDDIWKVEAWDKLRRMFPDNGNRSRIMFTSRLFDVANDIASSGFIHEMNLMDEGFGWDLFRMKTFGTDPFPPELESTGRAIAACCKGLPLAIVVIAGLLSADQKTLDVWERVAENVKAAISENEREFGMILSLSYTHLPHHLRPPFLYLGSFPEDYEMRVSKLIKLWVAEGFLKHGGSKKSLEEIADEYLNELVKRNLVMATKRKPNGRITRFLLHDLMREMCVRKAEELKFFLHVRGSLDEGAKLLRRVSIMHSDLDFLSGLTVHTVLCLDDRRPGKECSFGNCRRLRILELIDAQEYFNKNDNSLSTSLPDHLFELFHLRYLAFDYPFSIPSVVSNLRNLQTLIIKSKNHLEPVVLPMETWRLSLLRHILIDSCVFPSEEGATFALENLQTLQKPLNFVCSVEILDKISKLKKLGLSYKGDDEKAHEKDFELHNLERLQELEHLKIEVSNFPKEHLFRISPVFPNKLKNLTLSGLGLSWEIFGKVVSSLPNLQVLKLRDDACIGETWETTDGGFRRLELLLIEESHFENWETESNHFPKLKLLVLHRCWDLVEIPEVIGDVPMLELIEVDDCNGTLVESANAMRDYLEELYGDSSVQIRIIRDSGGIVGDEAADEMVNDDSNESGRD